mmetsp:Transcript_117962/g.306269  ORF Transcript_117962/g.306269 Transcript_117962/m.306269 type:complete len:1254 (-) Transcript_117962:320-4081(-)
MSTASPVPGEEDARSEESFQSADDDDDDFDLPQDLGPADGTQDIIDGDPRAAGSSGGALPPGFDDAPDGAGSERWNLRKDGNKEQLEPIWLRLSGEREHVKISKMFSYVLRHAAHKLDVHIRKDGFVRLREIMKLRNFKPYNLEELMAVVYFDEKERYTMVREFDGELLIRANQGHTMKVVEDDLLLETLTDASTVNDCVHGTYLVHWPFIKRQGLSKVARNHIHLANGLPEDGKIRGMRSTAELFVYVNVARAMEDGVIFYRSKNEVILTQGLDGWLPPKYFIKAVRIDYNTCDIEEMEFDTDAEMPTWAAELAPSGPGEQGTYLIKNLEALISNCKKRLQEITELKALAEQGQELTEEEIHKVTQHAQVYTELQSLEQRFRQHKGYRKESTQDRENRMKEEAEAGTVVKRKDRAVTPPWERGKASSLESTAMKATEKEKAEWAALGRRRDTAPTPVAKKEDPWSALGRTRSTPLGGATPSGKDHDFSKKPSFKTSSSFGGGGRDDGPPRLSREESWRFRGDEAPPLKREESSKMAQTPSGGGPPRFINSKKSTEGPSWRDRMSGSMSKDLDDGPSWRKDTPPRSSDDGLSWRDQMSGGAKPAVTAAGDGGRVPAQSSEAPARPSVPPPVVPPPPQAPAPPTITTSFSDSNAAASAPMWQSGQMCGFNSTQGMYYMASPSQQGQDGQMPGTPGAHMTGTPGNWMRQMPQQMQQQMPMQPMQPMQPGQPPPGAPGGAGGPPQMPGGPGYGYGGQMPQGQGQGGQGQTGPGDGSGMGGPPPQMAGGPQQPPGSYPMGPGGAPDGSSGGMVGMSPYPMDGQGVAPQAMMMGPGGVPGGYMVAMPQHGGQMPQGMMMVAGPGGVPGGYMMMPQGMPGMPPNMQRAMPGGPGQAQGHGQEGHQQQMMMMSMPAHGMGPHMGGGMNQVGMMGPGSRPDADGKGGSRVPALSRSAQPKQGPGWPGGADRRSGRPPALSGNGDGSQGPPQYPTGSPPPAGSPSGPGASSAGPAASESNSGGSKMSRTAKPSNPWADMHDPGHGGFDQDMRQLWDIRPGQSSRMSGGGPQTPQGAKHGGGGGGGGVQAGGSSGPGASPSGRNKGGQQQQARWVAVGQEPTPAPSSGKGQGKGGGQDRWSPVAAAPAAPTPAPLAANPPAKGGGGKKSKPKRDQQMDDWLSQRFQGAPPTTPRASEATAAASGQDDWGGDYAGGFDDSQDYGGEEGYGRRSGKKRGGKGQGAGGGRDKGKGKGKGGKWRASG